MDISLTEITAKQMASRLREAIGRESLTHSKSLEVLARTLGHPNWDTLAGLIKRDATTEAQAPYFKLVSPVTLYIGAFAVSEWGDSPDWARVDIDQEFIDVLLEMQALCKDGKLNEAARYWNIDWDQSVVSRMDACQLLVGTRSWWFQAYPKYADYACETRMIELEQLFAVLGDATRPSDGCLAWSKDVLLYDSSGDTSGLLDMLVEAGELDESYLPE